MGVLWEGEGGRACVTMARYSSGHIMFSSLSLRSFLARGSFPGGALRPPPFAQPLGRRCGFRGSASEHTHTPDYRHQQSGIKGSQTWHLPTWILRPCNHHKTKEPPNHRDTAPFEEIKKHDLDLLKQPKLPCNQLCFFSVHNEKHQGVI